MLNINARIQPVGSEGRQGPESYLGVETCLMKPLIGSEVHTQRPIDKHRWEHEASLSQVSTYNSGSSRSGDEYRHTCFD
jgi:hypothetical protein